MVQPAALGYLQAELAVKGYRLARIEDLAPEVWVRRLLLTWRPDLEVCGFEWIQMDTSYEPFSAEMKFATRSAFPSTSVSALLHPTSDSVVVLDFSEPHYGDIVSLWSGTITENDRSLLIRALQSGARLMVLGESYLEESDAIMQEVRRRSAVNRAVEWWLDHDCEYVVFTPTRGVRIVVRGRVSLEAQSENWWFCPRRDPDRVIFSIYGANTVQIVLPSVTPLLDLSGDIKVVRTVWDLATLMKTHQ